MTIHVRLTGDIVVIEDHRRTHPRLVPFLFRHVCARQGKPLDLAKFGLTAALRETLQETSATHHRAVASQADEMAGKTQELVVVLIQIPVDPRESIILAVHVVVAPLGIAKLVIVGGHRRALGKREGRQEVALLTAVQLGDPLVTHVIFDAVIP